MSIDDRKLREILLKVGASRTTITYSKAAAKCGWEWDPEVREMLIASLNRLAAQDKAAGLPLLAALVVTQTDRIPGRGFDHWLGLPAGASHEQRSKEHQKMLEAVFQRCRATDMPGPGAV